MNASSLGGGGSWSTNVISLNVVPSRILIGEEYYVWRPAVLERLNELVRLDKGWDGYGGLPVSFENATFALRMLEKSCTADAPTPQIVPASDGDLQIEWHEEGADIELHIRGPNDVHAWRLVAGSSEDEECHLTTDFSVIAKWIRELMESGSASEATAA